MKNNLENGDVDEYDDDEWDVKWQDWRTDNEVRIVELTRLLLTWRTKNEMRGRRKKNMRKCDIAYSSKAEFAEEGTFFHEQICFPEKFCQKN